MKIKVVAFDADDTLWDNELYFRETEGKFYELMEDYLPQHSVSRELLKSEIDNISIYGYGIKAFILSMIETALRISEGNISPKAINKIIIYGKEMLHKPVHLIDGVEQVLETLNGKYRLVMATKGDLLDQERKLEKSGLTRHFHHIEVMSEKKENDYRKLISHLDINASEFMMIGNSIKSDVLPVLQAGGYSVHVPHHITWQHEHVEVSVEHENFLKAETIRDVLKFI
jgi:putative hydrolase of the HAD superfamily